MDNNNDDFPWRKHTKDELINEYEKLKNKLNNTDIIFPIPYSRIGYKCSNNFFQYERIKTPSQGKKSCFDFWQTNKEKIEKNNKLTSSHDLFTTIVFMNHAPSQFPIFIAGQIYKYFKTKKVLDPFAGWGDRCLAAMALDIDYTGIDINTNLEPLYDNMISTYESKSKIKIIFKNCNKVNINRINYDLIFSSPPYWNDKNKLLEKYYNCENDYEIFMNDCLIPFIIKSLQKNPNIWVCLNIPPQMYNDIKKTKIGVCKKIIRFNTGSNTNGKNHSKNLTNCIYCF